MDGFPSPIAKTDLSPSNLTPTHTLTGHYIPFWPHPHLTPDPYCHRSKWQFVGGPFTQDIEVKSNLFVLSPNNKYMVSGGHWDNSFRVHLVERGKLAARIVHHNGGCGQVVGVVKCLLVCV